MPHNGEFCRNGLHPWTTGNTVVPTDGRPRCRLCANARQARLSTAVQNNKALRHRKRALVTAYKAERGCAVCGEKDPVVLDLDHRDPRTKHPRLRRKYGMREVASLSYVDIAAELEKCDVLCSNCHRRKTASHSDRRWRDQEVNS